LAKLIPNWELSRTITGLLGNWQKGVGGSTFSTLLAIACMSARAKFQYPEAMVLANLARSGAPDQPNIAQCD
jgi:hypothetical protein